MDKRKFLYPVVGLIFALILFLPQLSFSPATQSQAEELNNTPVPSVTTSTAAPVPSGTPTPSVKKTTTGTDCASCHSDVADQWKKTVHAKIAEGSSNVNPGCESCHGDGKLHADSGDPNWTGLPSKLSPEKSSAICYQCHRDSTRLMDWHSSEHFSGDVACIDCHDVHKKHTPAMLKQEDPDLCYKCHTEQKIQANLPSHHPINSTERGITFNCGTCHNPHSAMTKLTDMEVRDQCLKCHGDKQGPFMNEHPPAAENCVTCHNYLGSANNKLLRFSEPFLCLQCHNGTHVQTDANGNKFPHAFTGTFDTESAKYYTQCTVCHIRIHGSDDDSTFLR